MTGDIKVAAVAGDTNVAFKNYAPFTKCVTHINDEHVETAENLDIVMNLWQFKRGESPMNNAKNPLNVALDNSTSFKYKASLIGKATNTDGDDRSFKNTRLVVPLKYLSNFFRSLELPLINCKIHLELNWNNNCVMHGADTYAGVDNTNDREATFKITIAQLYVPIVTLSTRDNVNSKKQLEQGFKRSIFWDEYKSKIEIRDLDNDNATRWFCDASFQGVNRLFVFAFNNTDDNANKVKRDSHRKYFLPRVDITNYNVLIDGRNFMINQLAIKSKSMMKLERPQQEKEMITQQFNLIKTHQI